MTEPTYDSVIFDLDGVVVENPSLDRAKRATRTALDELDYDATDEEVTALLHEDPDQYRTFCRDAAFSPDELCARRDERAFEEQRAAVQVGEKSFHEDARIVESLSPRVGVVSNNQHRTVEFVLEAFELDAHVETAYGREPSLDGLARMKPEPFYVRRAMADLDAETPLYVGDGRSDVEVADRVGIDVAYVPRERDDGSDLDPEYLLSSLDELQSIVE